MPVFRVLAICGSLQADSSNLRLIKRLVDRQTAELDIHLTDELRYLPHFNTDLVDAQMLSPVEKWRQALAASDGLLIACPEYGHSLPGALKNGIDWVIGTGELYRKTVAITAAAAHPDRGLRGLAALKQTLLAVDAKIVWEKPMVNPTDAELDTLIQALHEGMAYGREKTEF